MTDLERQENSTRPSGISSTRPGVLKWLPALVLLACTDPAAIVPVQAGEDAGGRAAAASARSFAMALSDSTYTGTSPNSGVTIPQYCWSNTSCLLPPDNFSATLTARNMVLFEWTPPDDASRTGEPAISGYTIGYGTDLGPDSITTIAAATDSAHTWRVPDDVDVTEQWFTVKANVSGSNVAAWLGSCLSDNNSCGSPVRASGSPDDFPPAPTGEAADTTACDNVDGGLGPCVIEGVRLEFDTTEIDLTGLAVLRVHWRAPSYFTNFLDGYDIEIYSLNETDSTVTVAYSTQRGVPATMEDWTLPVAGNTYYARVRGDELISGSTSSRGRWTPSDPADWPAIRLPLFNRAPFRVNELLYTLTDSATVGEDVRVDADLLFGDDDGDSLTYTASSSDASVIRVSFPHADSLNIFTMTAVAAGSVVITTTARDPGGKTASSADSVRAYFVSNAAPDLTVQDASVDDATLETGASFTLSATVKNSGTAPAAATTLRYYRSTNATISATDTQVGTDAVAALGATVTSDESISLTAPSTARTYYYGACVAAVASESDTNNNCSSAVEVTVRAASTPNQAPTAVGTVPDQTVDVGEYTEIDAPDYFDDPDDDDLTYSAASSADGTATVRVRSNRYVRITGVAAGSATVTITARDPGGETASQPVSVTVEEDTTTTTTEPPAHAPRNLAAEAVVSTRIRVTWDWQAGTDLLYTVEGADGPNGPWTVLASDLAGTSYTESGLTPLTRRCYRVTVYNSAGSEGPTAAVCATTPRARGNIDDPVRAATCPAFRDAIVKKNSEGRYQKVIYDGQCHDAGKGWTLFAIDGQSAGDDELHMSVDGTGWIAGGHWVAWICGHKRANTPCGDGTDGTDHEWVRLAVRLPDS